jgi:hypothetical protein
MTTLGFVLWYDQKYVTFSTNDAVGTKRHQIVAYVTLLAPFGGQDISILNKM